MNERLSGGQQEHGSSGSINIITCDDISNQQELPEGTVITGFPDPSKKKPYYGFESLIPYLVNFIYKSNYQQPPDFTELDMNGPKYDRLLGKNEGHIGKRLNQQVVIAPTDLSYLPGKDQAIDPKSAITFLLIEDLKVTGKDPVPSVKQYTAYITSGASREVKYRIARKKDISAIDTIIKESREIWTENMIKSLEHVLQGGGMSKK